MHHVQGGRIYFKKMHCDVMAVTHKILGCLCLMPLSQFSPSPNFGHAVSKDDNILGQPASVVLLPKLQARLRGVHGAVAEPLSCLDGCSHDTAGPWAISLSILTTSVALFDGHVDWIDDVVADKRGAALLEDGLVFPKLMVDSADLEVAVRF